MERHTLIETPHNGVHINLYDDLEIECLTEKLDISKEALLRLVEKAGTLTQDVVKLLEFNKR